MSYTFSLEKEYFRLLAPIYITEEGLYKELPEDVGFAYLEAEVVYYVVLVSDSGEMRVQSFYNPPAKNKDNKVGGPVKFGATTFYTESGPGSTVLELTKAYNPRLTGATRTMYDAMWSALVADTPEWY